MEKGMFVGMGFDEIMAQLAEMGYIEEDFFECHKGDEMMCASIMIGDEFDHFSIDFGEDDIAEASYWEGEY